MNMSIDERIKEALGYDDANSRGSDEATALQLIGDTIRGRYRTLAWLAALFTFAMFGLTVFAAVRMFQASDVRETVLWAVGAMWGAMGVGLLKMWFWMQMDRYSLVREIKRLEVQIARLAEQMSRTNHVD